MSYGMKPRKIGVVVLGSMLITAPLFAEHFRRQEAAGQTKSDQAKPDQAAQSSSGPNAAPAANSASVTYPSPFYRSTRWAYASLSPPASTSLCRLNTSRWPYWAARGITHTMDSQSECGEDPTARKSCAARS